MGSITRTSCAPPLESYHECVDDLLPLGGHLGPGAVDVGGLPTPARVLARRASPPRSPRVTIRPFPPARSTSQLGRLGAGVLSNAGFHVLAGARRSTAPAPRRIPAGTESCEHGAPLRAPSYTFAGRDNSGVRPGSGSGPGVRAGVRAWSVRAATGAPAHAGSPAMMRSAWRGWWPPERVDIAHPEQGANVGVVRLGEERIDEEEHASISRMATPARSGRRRLRSGSAASSTPGRPCPG